MKILENYKVELLKREELENNRILLTYKITHKSNSNVDFFEVYYNGTTGGERFFLYKELSDPIKSSHMYDIVNEFITDDLDIGK